MRDGARDGVSYLALVHIMQSLLKVLDRVDFTKLVDGEPAFAVKVDEFRNKLSQGRGQQVLIHTHVCVWEVSHL